MFTPLIALESALLISGLASAAAGVGSTIATNRARKKMQEEVNEENKKLVQEQNAYNSPVAQMSRYQAAGINPYAGSTDVGSGNQADVASLGVPEFDAPDFAAFGDAVNNSLGYQLQASKNKSVVDLNNARVQLTIAQSGNVQEQTRQLKDLFGLKEEKLIKECAEIENRIMNGLAQIDKTWAETRNIEAAIKVANKQLEVMTSQVGLNDAQAALLRERVNTEKTAQGVNTQLARNYAAMANISEAEAKRVMAYIDFYLSHNGVESEFNMLKWDSLSKGEQQKVLHNAAVYAQYETQFAEDVVRSRAYYEEWKAEDMQHRAGISYDQWQNGVWQSSVGVITGAVSGVASAAGAVVNPASRAAGVYRSVNSNLQKYGAVGTAYTSGYDSYNGLGTYYEP